MTQGVVQRTLSSVAVAMSNNSCDPPSHLKFPHNNRGFPISHFPLPFAVVSAVAARAACLSNLDDASVETD